MHGMQLPGDLNEDEDEDAEGSGSESEDGELVNEEDLPLDQTNILGEDFGGTPPNQQLFPPGQGDMADLHDQSGEASPDRAEQLGSSDDVQVLLNRASSLHFLLND
jgi:hypothetical protein